MCCKRPLMWLCILYLTVLGGCFLLNEHLAYGGILLLPGAAWCVLRRKQNRWFWLAAVIVVVFAGLRCGAIAKRQQAWDARAGQTVSLSGIVESVSYATDRGAQLTVKLQQVDACRLPIRIQLTADASVDVSPFEKFTCQAVITAPSCLSWDDSERMYQFSQGVLGGAAITAGSMTVMGTAITYHAVCEQIRTRCTIRLHACLNRTSAQLLSGMVLGERRDVPAVIKRDFRRAGVSHLLAVSGMHLAVLTYALEYLLRKLKLHHSWRIGISAGFVLLFAGMTGCTPSILRAALMWGIALFAELLGGRRDVYTALFLSVALICIFDPYAILDIGLQLSALAVFGIVYLGLPAAAAIRSYVPKWLRDFFVMPVVLTTAALVFTFPVTLYTYRSISIAAPLANICLNIPMMVLLAGTPFLLLFSCLPFSMLTAAAAYMLEQVCGFFLWIVQLLSMQRGVLIDTAYPFTGGVILFVIAVGLLLYRKTRRQTSLFAAYGAGIILFFTCLMAYRAAMPDALLLTYRMQKKNEQITISNADHQTVMIDITDGAYNAAREGWDILSENHVTELEAVVLTHYHRKHSAMLQRLAETVIIRQLLLPLPETEDERIFYETLYETAEQNQIDVVPYTRGTETIQCLHAKITIYPPAYLPRSTQPLLCMTIASGTETVCYASAAAWESEDTAFQAELYNAAASAQYLVCGVHSAKIKAPFGFCTGSGPYRVVTCPGAAAVSFFAGNGEMTVDMEHTEIVRIRLR